MSILPRHAVLIGLSSKELWISAKLSAKIGSQKPERLVWFSRKSPFKNVLKILLQLIDPELYFQACVRNHCACRVARTMDCLCDTLDAFVKASNNAGGNSILWRDAQVCPCESKLLNFLRYTDLIISPQF